MENVKKRGVMARKVCTVKFRDGYERTIYARSDNTYFQRETWPAEIDREEGYTIYARSVQQETSYFNAFAYTREYFGLEPERCNGHERFI